MSDLKKKQMNELEDLIKTCLPAAQLIRKQALIGVRRDPKDSAAREALNQAEESCRVLTEKIAALQKKLGLSLDHLTLNMNQASERQSLVRREEGTGCDAKGFEWLPKGARLVLKDALFLSEQARRTIVCCNVYLSGEGWIVLLSDTTAVLLQKNVQVYDSTMAFAMAGKAVDGCSRDSRDMGQYLMEDGMMAVRFAGIWSIHSPKDFGGVDTPPPGAALAMKEEILAACEKKRMLAAVRLK